MGDLCQYVSVSATVDLTIPKIEDGTLQTLARILFYGLSQAIPKSNQTEWGKNMGM